MLRQDPARRRPYISLFWRLFVPNAVVIVGAGVWRWSHPANGELPLIITTVLVMLLVNLLLMRRAIAPLERLNATIVGIEPPTAGTRIEVSGPESEVTRLTRSFNDMLDRLETERRESARRAMQAEEEERRRIAGELHDGLGQDLTALMLELRAIAAESPRSIAHRLRAAETHTLRMVEDVRRLARQLRPEALDELGLVPAMAALCKRISRAAPLDVHFVAPRTLEGLGAAQELMIYRVAQESLTNAVRHSHARHADVEVAEEGGAVTLTVSDDGQGLERPPAPGGGISGMRERAMLNGGRLDVETRDRGGVTVRLRVDREAA